MTLTEAVKAMEEKKTVTRNGRSYSMENGRIIMRIVLPNSHPIRPRLVYKLTIEDEFATDWEVEDEI